MSTLLENQLVIQCIHVNIYQCNLSLQQPSCTNKSEQRWITVSESVREIYELTGYRWIFSIGFLMYTGSGSSMINGTVWLSHASVTWTDLHYKCSSRILNHISKEVY